MCLGIPGQIIRRWVAAESQLPMALVDFGGTRKEVCLALIPEAQDGEYVMVHVGVAIARVDAQAAQETWDLVATLGIDP